jgi:hypothetical protein
VIPDLKFKFPQMQNQIPDQVPSSEEIYNEMIRDTFDVSEINTSQEEDSFHGEGFSMQIGSDSDSKDNLLVQRIVNTLTAQLQDFLPGAFRITPLPEQCLSYANLHSWSPRRSYFSLFEMQQSKSVWILHLSRSVGEGFASLNHSKNSKIYRNIYHDLREADSVIYLETANMLRKLFGSLLELWPASYKLKVARYRHILQLGFLQGHAQDDEYVVLPFYLDNNECSGEINLVFPERYILNIVGA